MNAKDCKFFYPEYECRFYVDESVPYEWIVDLQKEGAKIHYVNKLRMGWELEKRALFRYLTLDDPKVELALFRDADSKIIQREVDYVNEWLSTNKQCYIVREFPLLQCKTWEEMKVSRYPPIDAGKFGCRKIKGFRWYDAIVDYDKRNAARITNKNFYQFDENFLRDVIYPLVFDDACIFDNWSNYLYETNVIRHDIEYDDHFEIIGNYYKRKIRDGAECAPHIGLMQIYQFIFLTGKKFR